MRQRSPLSLQLSVLTAFGLLDASKKRGRGIGGREGQFLRSRRSSRSARSCQRQVKHLRGLVRWLKEACCQQTFTAIQGHDLLEIPKSLHPSFLEAGFLAGFLQGIATLILSAPRAAALWLPISRFFHVTAFKRHSHQLSFSPAAHISPPTI